MIETKTQMAGGGNEKKRAWPWFVAAVAVFVSGYVGAGVLGWRMVNAGAGLQLVEVPGETTVRLEPGEYTIYHEFEGVADDKFYYHALRPPAFVPLLRPAGGGDRLSMKDLTPQPIYRFGARRGAELATVTIESAGDYILGPRYIIEPPETGGELPTVIAIGDGRERRAMVRLQWVWTITLLTTAIGVVLVVRGLFIVMDRRVRG
jgi:hypothetical protein